MAVIATMFSAFVLVIIPIMFVVLFVVAVLPALWALVIPRLRDYIHGRGGVIDRCPLIVHRVRLHINWAGLYVYGPGLAVNRVGVVGANQHPRHTDAHRNVDVVSCLCRASKSHCGQC